MIRRQFISIAIFAIITAIFSCHTTSAQSQGNYRVIIMGEDSDPAVVRRSNDIYKRVIAEMRRPMRQSNFDILDEDMIAANLGFVYRSGMDKREVIQAAMIANRSKNVNNRVRFLALIRIHVFSETLSFTKQVHVRLDGELHDMDTSLFIDAYEIPETTFPAPADCNDICLVEKAGAYARDMATNLGSTLTKQLRIYIDGNPSTSSAVPSGTTEIVARSFTVTLKNFSASEANQIVRNIRESDSQPVTLELIESDGVLRRYQYVTREKNDAINDHIYALLRKINLSENQVNVAIGNQSISIEKLR